MWELEEKPSSELPFRENMLPSPSYFVWFFPLNTKQSLQLTPSWYLMSPSPSFIWRRPRCWQGPHLYPMWSLYPNLHIPFLCNSVHVLTRALSHIQLFVTPWTVARQAPLSMEFSGILEILEWVAIPFSKGSFQPSVQTHVSCLFCVSRQILYHCATWEALLCNYLLMIKAKTLEFCLDKLIIQHVPSLQYFKILQIWHLLSNVVHHCLCRLNESVLSGKPTMHTWGAVYFVFPLPRILFPQVAIPTTSLLSVSCWKVLLVRVQFQPYFIKTILSSLLIPFTQFGFLLLTNHHMTWLVWAC